MYRRIALVTGADRDIGMVIATALAAAGARVVDLQLEENEDIVRRSRDAGDPRFPASLHGNVVDEPFCNRAIDYAIGEFGHLDILVNAHLDWTARPNALPLLGLTLAALPWLTPGSSVIHSISGPGAPWNRFSGSAAIVAFTRNLARDLMPRGIRVNALATVPMWSSSAAWGSGVNRLDAQSHTVPAAVLLDRLARGGVFLASRDSAYMTGRILEVWRPDYEG